MIFATIFIAFSLFLSSRSTKWTHQSFFKAVSPWSKLNSGWIIDGETSSIQDGKLSIKRVFSQNDCLKELFFITHNQNVFMTIDDGSETRTLYSSGYSGKQLIGSESGNAIHVVKIPECRVPRFVITIQFKKNFTSKNEQFNRWYYQMFRGTIPTIYIGNEDTCISSCILKSLYQVIPIVLQLISAGIILIFYFVNHRNMKSRRCLHIFWFTMITTICLLCESHIGFLFSKNTFSLYLLSTLFIAIRPSAFMFLLQEKKLLSKDERIYKLLNLIILANIFITCVLSFCTFIPFTFVRIYLLAFNFILDCYGIILIFSDSFSIKATLDVLDVLILINMAGFTIDMVRQIFFGDSTDLFFFTRIGILFLYIFYIFNAIQDFFNKELVKARSETLKNATERDMLTGCLNFYNMEKQEIKNDFVMFLFNITNIDNIFSENGQNEKNNALRSFAQILKIEFLKDSIYKLYSAKFGVIGSNRSNEICEKQIQDIVMNVEGYNKLSMNSKIKIAYTYGRFDAATDTNLDGLYSRLLVDLHKKSVGI